MSVNYKNLERAIFALGSLEARKVAREIGISPWFLSKEGKQVYLKAGTLKSRMVSACRRDPARARFLEGFLAVKTDDGRTALRRHHTEQWTAWQKNMKRVQKHKLYWNDGIGGSSTTEFEDEDRKLEEKADDTFKGEETPSEAEAREIDEAQAKAEGKRNGNGLATSLEVFVREIINKHGVDEERVKSLVESQLGEIKDLLKQKPRQIEIIRPDKHKVDLGLTHKQFPELLQWAQATSDRTWVNIWVAGPAGSGKSHAGRQVAKALDRPFYTNGAIDLEHKLMGYEDANGKYRTTPFREAFDKPSVYVFDEVDRSNTGALLAFDGALANGHCDFPGFPAGIERHPECVIIACGNTFGYGADSQYVGAARMDAAFLDRFVHIEWEYDEALERAVAGNDEIVSEVQSLRAKARGAGLKVVISPRASIYASQLVRVGVKPKDALHAAVFAKLSKSDRKALEVA